MSHTLELMAAFHCMKREVCNLQMLI